MGVESYVNDKLEKGDTTWFPFNKSRHSTNVEEEKEFDLLAELNQSISNNKRDLQKNSLKIAS